MEGPLDDDGLGKVLKAERLAVFRGAMRDINEPAESDVPYNRSELDPLRCVPLPQAPS
jgi:hypothetical protein